MKEFKEDYNKFKINVHYKDEKMIATAKSKELNVIFSFDSPKDGTIENAVAKLRISIDNWNNRWE